MTTRRWLALIWLCFSARLAFYATAFPLWEGFDEWAHFAVARGMASGGPIVAPRDATLPLDVAASLQFAPMPPTVSDLPPDALSHEAFWALPPDGRRAREAQFRAIPPEYAREASTFAAYEALQPPLYYWLTAPVLWAARSCSLVTQVFLLRWVSALLGSLVVPLVFLLARAVFAQDRPALGCAAVVALMPELAIDMARVSNECVAVVLYSLVILLATERRSGPALGIALGLGLIAKAYFLAALAGVALVLWAPRSFAIAAAISGWWYARNVVTTGTLSGLSEAVTLRGAGPAAMLHGAGALPWGAAVDSILFSHLYFGGWSSLTVRSWMYHVLYLLIALAAVGVVGLWRKPEIRSLAFLYGAFWVAQLYNVTLIYLTKGVPTSMGWYMYAVIGAQAVLSIAGLRRLFGGAAVAIGAGLFGLLDLYAMNALALPYYTGMLARKSSGALAALKWSDVGIAELFERLTVFKPPFITTGVMAALWALYLAATLALIAAAVQLSRGVRKP